MENKINCDPFREENSLSKELMVLKAQDEMVQILILEEIKRNQQEVEEPSFSLTNLPEAKPFK